MPFGGLPTEILLQILPRLDLPSLLKLLSTNHYFKTLATDSLLGEALLSYEAVNSDDLQDAGIRPCYGCLQMLSENDFFKVRGSPGWEDITVVGLDLDRGLCKERRCYECDGEVGKKFEEAMKFELLQACNGESTVCPDAELRSRSILLIYSILAPLNGMNRSA